MKVYGVIMAGGGGTRFWPLSRAGMPKQLLNLSGKAPMINEAIDRLLTVAPEIFVVTNARQADALLSMTEGRLRADHVLKEPCGRNTAACIGYAAMEIIKKYGDGVMIVTPSDAYIRNLSAFTEVLKKGVAAAESGEHLVTIGIEPTFPATGYGYIQMSGEGDVRGVCCFREKPDFETAKEYLLSGDYVWNSGMFIWKASAILRQFAVFLPDLYKDLLKIGESMGTAMEEETIRTVYPSMRSISVDYGIMEKSGDILVIPGEFGWSDVGSWDMMEKLHEKDAQGNVLIGNALALDSSDSVLYSSGRLVAGVDLQGMVVVETKDAVLVCPKDKVQDVKKIVDRLKAENREEYL